MSSLNKVQLIGRLGKDPEVKYTNDNVAVAKLTVATSETYKDKTGAKQEITEWHNVVCWRNLAEIAEKFLTKGKQVYIEGKLRTRNWEDKDGNKRYTTEIIADNFLMLDKKESSGSETHTETAAPKTANTAPPIETVGPEDDLPF
jgi:single-strand DNA-binding protein